MEARGRRRGWHKARQGKAEEGKAEEVGAKLASSHQFQHDFARTPAVPPSPHTLIPHALSDQPLHISHTLSAHIPRTSHHNTRPVEALTIFSALTLHYRC